VRASACVVVGGSSALACNSVGRGLSWLKGWLRSVGMALLCPFIALFAPLFYLLAS